MGNNFLTAPMREVRQLLKELESALQALEAGGGRVAEFDEYEAVVLAHGQEVKAELMAAEMSDEMEILEVSLDSSDAVGLHMRSELLDLFKPLNAALVEAVGKAREAAEGIAPAVDSAMDVLDQKRAALGVLLAAARAVQEEQEAALEEERRRVLGRREVSEPEESSRAYEETMPFEQMPDDEEEEPDGEEEGAERRRHRRDNLAIEVKLEGHNRLLSTSTENVSVGGIFIATTHGFELGTLLHVICELPDGRVVEAEGVVSWCREEQGDVVPGIGVEFMVLADEDRAELEQLTDLIR